MSLKAVDDTDFVFLDEGRARASCKWCALTINAVDADNHRKTCPERPESYRPAVIGA